jgi:shikimate dehydrogenase
MLDGEGFADAIAEAGCRFEGRRALLIGAGGAGSAIALALLERGVATLAVHDSDPARRDALTGKLAAKFGDRIGPGADDPAQADILVNATPRGMASDDPMPVDVSRLTAATFVGDVITVPEVTPLLQAARARGCLTQTGVGMFLGVLGRMAEFFEGPAWNNPRPCL